MVGKEWFTGKNNRFPILDILGYLKNTHKNPKFGKVRQIPTREFPTKFPGWDLSHSSKFGIFVGIFLNTLKYPKMGICYFFLWLETRLKNLCRTTAPFLSLHVLTMTECLEEQTNKGRIEGRFGSTKSCFVLFSASLPWYITNYINI